MSSLSGNGENGLARGSRLYWMGGMTRVVGSDDARLGNPRHRETGNPGYGSRATGIWETILLFRVDIKTNLRATVRPVGRCPENLCTHPEVHKITGLSERPPFCYIRGGDPQTPHAGETPDPQSGGDPRTPHAGEIPGPPAARRQYHAFRNLPTHEAPNFPDNHGIKSAHDSRTEHAECRPCTR